MGSRGLGWGAEDGLWVWVSQKRAWWAGLREQYIRNFLHWFLMKEGKKMGRYHMHTPTCSHTYEPDVDSQGGLGCEH